MPAAVFAASLSPSSSSIAFQNTAVGSTANATLTLRNSGRSAVTISSVSISGPFRTANFNPPLRLWGRRSVTISLVFAPTSAGSFSGRLTVNSNAPAVSVGLSGTGTGSSTPAATLSISPTSFAFGNVTVNSTATKSATLKAGAAGVTISAATTSNPEFTLSGIKLPLSLAANASAAVTVAFKPTSSGSTSAQFALTSNAGTTSASATGTGTAAKAHSVTLQWTPSGSTVAGYYIYRGTTTGGPYTRLNSAANVSASYVDASVQSGATYFYVASAVDANGVESVKSNEVRAAIPTP
jgi:hypothetical protein